MAAEHIIFPVAMIPATQGHVTKISFASFLILVWSHWYSFFWDSSHYFFETNAAAKVKGRQQADVQIDITIPQL